MKRTTAQPAVKTLKEIVTAPKTRIGVLREKKTPDEQVVANLAPRQYRTLEDVDREFEERLRCAPEQLVADNYGAERAEVYGEFEQPAIDDGGCDGCERPGCRDCDRVTALTLQRETRAGHAPKIHWLTDVDVDIESFGFAYLIDEALYLTSRSRRDRLRENPEDHDASRFLWDFRKYEAERFFFDVRPSIALFQRQSERFGSVRFRHRLAAVYAEGGGLSIDRLIASIDRHIVDLKLKRTAETDRWAISRGRKRRGRPPASFAKIHDPVLQEELDAGRVHPNFAPSLQAGIAQRAAQWPKTRGAYLWVPVLAAVKAACEREKLPIGAWVEAVELRYQYACVDCWRPSAAARAILNIAPSEIAGTTRFKFRELTHAFVSQWEHVIQLRLRGLGCVFVDSALIT